MKASPAFGALSVFSLITGVLTAATNSSLFTSNTTLALLADGNVNLGIASDAYEKAKAFVATLTNSQKISIITGSSITDDNATWTALTSKNGGSGINMNFYVSGFLLPGALTMTWNRTAFQSHFKALGDEFYDAGYNLIYGPVSSPSGRVVYGGRVAEGFSPDPYLNGIALGDSVTSLNSAGVIAVGRHFLFNEQETNRSSTIRYSANVDDKTTREVYLWSFADGVKAGCEYSPVPLIPLSHI
jgi:beta-glucosidase